MLQNPLRKFIGSIVFATCLTCSGASAAVGTTEVDPVVWKFESASRVGNHTATVLGSPRVVREGKESALCFDGISDAIFLPVNPIAGWTEFTVEALIKADAPGPEEQRFLHIQDERDSRLLLETRLTPQGKWALDTFLFVPPDVRRTLLDLEKLHPAGQWQWVGITFDGERMVHYVNGRKELEGEIAFRPMTSGRTSVGVRQNKVSWYKGCIREIRFTPRALQDRSLQQ